MAGSTSDRSSLSFAASLYRSPNALAPLYSRFDVGNRLLLTGHSHQAWPDRAFEGHQQAWLDAACLVDGKWEHAFARAERVRQGYLALLGDPVAAEAGHEGAAGSGAGSADRAVLTLAPNTHDLIVRFLSALPLRKRPRLVTTTGEFHTIRRQLDRLAEEGIEVVKVGRDPVDTLPERLSAEVDDRTAAVLVSTVFFQDARIVRGLGVVMEACAHIGAELLLDTYHHLGVVPCSLLDEGLERAFAVGGGYKYCQLGEGNAFLRVPAGTSGMRPVVTGWFSEFSAVAAEEGAPSEDGDAGADRGARMADPAAGRRVLYGSGADRFAGATYDPTSHYRGAEVFDFFHEMGLTPGLLREVSQHQVGLLAGAFDALDLDPARIDRDRDVPLSEIGGFLALRTPHAEALSGALRDRGIFTDYRADRLRLGPAPYLADAQLEAAVGALEEAVRALQG